MKDEDIGNLLRKLPRQQASTGFTDRLMKRMPTAPPTAHPRTRLTRSGLAVAAAVVLTLAASSARNYWQGARERAEAAQRVEALRSEYESLHKELEELKALAAESQPILTLGGTGEMDFLMDLRALSREAEGARAHPVNYRR